MKINKKNNQKHVLPFLANSDQELKLKKFTLKICFRFHSITGNYKNLNKKIIITFPSKNIHVKNPAFPLVANELLGIQVKYHPLSQFRDSLHTWDTYNHHCNLCREVLQMHTMSNGILHMIAMAAFGDLVASNTTSYENYT